MLVNPVCGYRHLEELTVFIFMVDVSNDGMWWVMYEDGNSSFLQNIGNHPQDYRVSQSRRPWTKIATDPYV